jgi:hypothetical protein
MAGGGRNFSNPNKAGAMSFGMTSENFGYSAVRLKRVKKLQFGVVNPDELVRLFSYCDCRNECFISRVHRGVERWKHKHVLLKQNHLVCDSFDSILTTLYFVTIFSIFVQCFSFQKATIFCDTSLDCKQS